MATLKHTSKHGRTRKAKSKQIGIAFHSENALAGVDAHPAVNVKVYSLPEVNVSEDERGQAYDAAVMMFWDNAWIIAQQHGYSGVFSEGRSSGWCVPFYQYVNGKLQQLRDWSGQGPGKGYPTYPDVEDASERRRFIRFRADILELIDAAKRFYVEQTEEKN